MAQNIHNNPMLRKNWKQWEPPKEKFWKKCGKKTRGRANFYVVYKGKNTGVYYKWSDCKQAIAADDTAKFKGCQTLQEAYDTL